MTENKVSETLGLTSDDGEFGVLRKVGFSQLLDTAAAREQFTYLC